MKKTVAELWEDIFNDYDIINEINNNGCFIISANQIRPYKEPRLMTKFDFSSQVPQIFKNNNLGILPITNGEYIIELMQQHTDLTNPVTLNRRASTVRGWIEWIIGCQI